MTADPPRPEHPDPPTRLPAPAAAQSGEPHDDEGLDLARSLTRATTGRKSRKGSTGRRRQDDSRSPRGAVSGAHPDERDPQLLDTTVARVVADHGWELELRIRGVFARWPELVGPDVAAHANPESFADGRLVVRAESTAWATQLRLLAPAVLRRLNEDLGHDTVTVLEVLGPRGPTWKKGPRSVRDGRGPRDTYG